MIKYMNNDMIQFKTLINDWYSKDISKKVRSGDDYKWRGDSIKRILKSQVYIGNTEYGKKMNLIYKSKKVKNIPREDWKIALNTHEAIIDKETFEEVQKMLKDKYNRK
jgi:hypothetical protein